MPGPPSGNKTLENLPINGNDITDMREVIELSIEQDEDLQKYLRVLKVRNGDPLAFTGDMDDVGIAGSGCDPTYQEIGIVNKNKRWELGEWQIPIKICYDSFKGSIAEYAMKTGTNIADLTNTDIMSYIIRPKLERQIRRMMWRLAWFGDKNAQKASSGGVIDPVVNTGLFKSCDGFWKKIFKISRDNPEQWTRMPQGWNSNINHSQNTSAIKVMDEMLADADSRISADGEATILMTKKFASRLCAEMKDVYKEVLPWQTIFEGLDVSMYDGVKIARVSIWDQMIRAYEKTPAPNLQPLNPYRAVYANINKQFLVGTDTGGLITDLDIWFDKKERRNYIYATGKIGTQILEDDMFQVAY